MRQSLKIDRIRETLELMEDRIIFRLLERSQYATNEPIYRPGGIQISGFNGSLLDYLMQGREGLDWTAGRYEDRREHPFFPRPADLTVVLRREPDQSIPTVTVNRNDEIMEMYLKAVKKISKPGDDKEYGTCAIIDISALQEISSRVHLGEFVAESKWRSNGEVLKALIEAKDWAGLEEALRDRTVEEKVAARVGDKGARYGINPDFIDFIRDFYINNIIPLTISVEVEYLRKRPASTLEGSRSIRVNLLSAKLKGQAKFNDADDESIRAAADKLITLDNQVLSRIITADTWEQEKAKVLVDLAKVSIQNKTFKIGRRTSS